MKITNNQYIKGMVMLGIIFPTLAVAQLMEDYNVGINNANPSATLHIVGRNQGQNTETMEVSVGSKNATRTRLFTILDNKKIGIMQENPQSDLHIKSDGTKPALFLETEGTSSLSKTLQNMMTIDYNGSYAAATSYAVIGDGSGGRRFQINAVPTTTDVVLRSESKYGDGHYSEYINYKAGSSVDFSFRMREGAKIYYTDILADVWKIGDVNERLSGSLASVEGSNLHITGAMVLGNDGYNPTTSTAPAGGEGTMIFYKPAGADEGSFYVYTNRGWKKMDND